jgi:hypothetical protein
VVVQVLLRNGNALYVTDGVYGSSLSDAGAPGFRFPARLLRPSVAATHDYMLFGPTCDSADRMAGPFSLPADVAEGDWIEIGQLGAYGACLRTGFNGFDTIYSAEVRDPPMSAGMIAVVPQNTSHQFEAPDGCRERQGRHRRRPWEWISRDEADASFHRARIFDIRPAGVRSAEAPKQSTKNQLLDLKSISQS